MSENKPAIKNGCLRRTVKYSYLVGAISTLVCSLLLASYLFAYPFRSNVCNGLVGDGTLSGDKDEAGIADRCKNQVTARGYKSTTLLVNGGLLPADWTKKVTAADGTETYEICEWNSNVEECLQAEPDHTDCESEKNADGTRKNKWGDDGKCEALKSPEICRQTGFLKADDAEKRTELANAGAAAEAAAVVLIITGCLAILQTLNYFWPVLFGCCGKSIESLCEVYGRPCGKLLKLDEIICGNANSCKCLAFISKRNRVKPNSEFTEPLEAATICCSFFTHNALILVFGVTGMIAKNSIEDSCYAAKNVDGCKAAPTAAEYAAGTKKCVYDTDKTAKDFIEALTGTNNDSNAKAYLENRNRLYDVAIVFWWINLIAGGIQLVGYLAGNSESADMENVAIRSTDDLLCANIDAREDNSVGTEAGFKQLYAPKKVQLRGQF